MNDDELGAIFGMLGRRNEVLGKNCLSAALSTTNPTRLVPDSNSGRRSGKPATSRLCYGTAIVILNGNFITHLCRQSS
jgi:hypothetical protein